MKRFLLALTLLFALFPRMAFAAPADELKAIALTAFGPAASTDQLTITGFVTGWALVTYTQPGSINEPISVVLQEQNGSWSVVAGPALPATLRNAAPADLFQANPYTDGNVSATISAMRTQTVNLSGVQLQIPADATAQVNGTQLSIAGPFITGVGNAYFLTISLEDTTVFEPLDEWGLNRVQAELAANANTDGPNPPLYGAWYWSTAASNVWQEDWFGGDSISRHFYIQAKTGGPVIHIISPVVPPSVYPNWQTAQDAQTLALWTITPSLGTGGHFEVYSDPSQPIQVANGQAFQIALAANFSTGYSWQIASYSSPSVVSFLSTDYESPAQAMPGAGGTQLLSFRATAPGTSEINLVYKRPNSTEAPARTTTFRVTVK